MDTFKQAQSKNIGIGGIKCQCCNKLARKCGGKKVDKKLNRIARSIFKRMTKKIISTIL